jgi:type IV pilus assembly protein PilA
MKKSNKGFSLVELIIVIAIMAILIAVLAPQYLKYVEKTKRNSDAKAFGEVVQATEVAIADPLNQQTDSVTVTWTGGASGAFSFSTGTSTGVKDDVCEVINGSAGTYTLKGKSKQFQTSSSVTFTITSTGNWSKTSTGPFSSYVEY